MTVVPETSQSLTQRHPVPRVGPLAGVRVADFCWMGVGSVATRLLADFGAEVIKIENRRRIDRPRLLPIYKGEVRNYGEEVAGADPNRGGLHNNYSRNKLGITVDMKTSRGRELVDRLIAASSVVTENFAPGVMERWGLTYERLNELSPEVIYGRMSGFGHTGPHAHFKSYGPIVQAVSGLSFISGLPGREPSGWGLSYMDNQAAYYSSAALMMAILRRNKTGKGAEIDVSAVEVGISLIGPDLLDVSVNKAVTRRPDFPRGNRLADPKAAPHGVYPSLGEDRWVAIAVFNDAEWGRFVRALGDPEWSRDPKFATQALRHAHQDELDEHVSAWTRTRTPQEAMEILQQAGIAAGAVQNAEDLNEYDPQLAHRGTFFELDHPVIGVARFEGVPIKFSRTVQHTWRSAPLLGEDNHYVFGEILGLSKEEIADLEAEGVIDMWDGPTGELTYSGLRVVELAQDPPGEIVGKLLADQGAEVVKVEPPEGARGRHIGPFVTGRDGDPEASLHFWTYNTSKRSVVIDTSTEEGRARRAALIAAADVLITSDGPRDLAADGLDLHALVAEHEQLIALSVSPFGLTGPWADWRTSDLVALAAGGILSSCGYDDHSIPPIRPGGNQGFQIAASFGHCGLLLALLERQATGLGQVVDVSMHEAIAVSGELANPYWFYPRVLIHRQTCRHAQPHPTQPALFECADGVQVYFALILSDTRTWQTLVDWLASLGMDLDLGDEKYLSLAYRQARFSHIQTIMESFFMMQDSATVYREAQRRGLPLGPVLAPEQLLDDEHLAERGYFVPVRLPIGGEALFPGSPYRFSYPTGAPGQPPRLGADTDEVFAALEDVRA